MRDNFQSIERLLSEGFLAAYLLGYDESKEETSAIIQKIEFADDDKRAEKAGPLDLRFDVPPKEAIDYFERKRILTKSEFNKLSREAKAAAFTVSGIYQEDILQAFKKEIETALRDGSTQRTVVKNFKSILDGAGHKELGDFHLETIARSNMMSAYGLGKRKQMEEVSDLLPFWQRNAVNDDRTRPAHRALDGVIFPADHEFWDTHYPPDDFNCRCSISAILDYPQDYDHSRPNPDTTIAYDKDGLPAKAEYLNQVVDLKATDFAGVPKITNLEKTIRKNAQKSLKTRNRSDKPKDKSKRDIPNLENIVRDLRGKNFQTPTHIIEEAFNIKDVKTELGRWYDADGLLLRNARGTINEIPGTIPPDFLDQYAYGIRLHNHPPQGRKIYESFSPEDIQAACDFKLSEELVITQNYIYSMRPSVAGWDGMTSKIIEEVYEKNYLKIAKKMQAKLRSGELTSDEIFDIERHETWKLVAKELGLDYKRIAIREKNLKSWTESHLNPSK